MQSRSQRRRRILKQAITKKSKIEDTPHITQQIESDYEDISSDEEHSDKQFEDEYDDEYDVEEGEINIDSEDEEQLEQIEQAEQVEEEQQQPKQPTLKRKKKGMESEEPTKRVWFYDEAENLDFDNRAYNMLHRITTEWPCLSCDYVLTEEELQKTKNKEFLKMNKYPYTVYLAAGTQAAQPSKNQIYLLKLSKMHKTKYDDDEVSQSEDDSEDDNLSNDEEGQVTLSSVNGLKCGVNRIKSMNGQPIVAYWNENGDVNILDLNPLHKKLLNNQQSQFNISQLHHRTFKNQQEGFALDWSKLKMGDLISGSLDGKIYLHHLDTDWSRENKAYEYHKGSVEDLQFSPLETFAFASCSTDGNLCIVDTREGKHKQAQIIVKAHNCDVNVLSWNQVSANLLATGADDGCFKVWDLRYPKNDAISEIQFHNKAITSIQFQPNSDSTLAVSSEDHKLSIWDFAVENENNQENEDIPDQLMFVHQGQKDLKELKYHPLYYEMIVSTSSNGFNVFKPTLDEDEKKSESEDDNEHQIPVIKEEELDKYFQQMSLQ